MTGETQLSLDLPLENGEKWENCSMREMIPEFCTKTMTIHIRDQKIHILPEKFTQNRWGIKTSQ